MYLSTTVVGNVISSHLVLAHTPQLSNPPGRRPLASCLTALPWPMVWPTVPRHILAPLSGPPGIWLLDCSIVDRGMVVPQMMWSPHSALDRRRHVERAQLQMPIFFEGEDRRLGISQALAASTRADSRCHIPRDANHLAPLAQKSSALPLVWP
ncbi:hypothetical protein EDB85DRAFT_1965508 [Lactarius pseudohatsudake]|nr:hypothetical protein EDB85DRAFT_1965508 [Lactarius pseudohatsudake]